jgi:nucleoside-diphosphate-sugar epimerase
MINIACGGRITINQLFESIKKAAGNDVQPIYRAERAGDVRDSLADISLAQDLIGYAPEFGIDEGLRITTQWFKKEFID